MVFYAQLLGLVVFTIFFSRSDEFVQSVLTGPALGNTYSYTFFDTVPRDFSGEIDSVLGSL